MDSSPSQHQHFIKILLPTWDGRISGHFLGPFSEQKKNGAVSLFHWGHFAVDSSKGSGGFIPQVTASAVVRTVVWKLISNINKRRKTFLAIPSITVEFWRESKWNGSKNATQAYQFYGANMGNYGKLLVKRSIFSGTISIKWCIPKETNVKKTPYNPSFAEITVQSASVVLQWGGLK